MQKNKTVIKLRSISTDYRWDILKVIRNHGPLTCTQILERVGKSQANVSQSLTKMKKAGVLKSKRGEREDYKYIYYEIEAAFLPMMDAMGAMK